MGRQPKRPVDAAEMAAQNDRVWNEVIRRLRPAYDAGCYLEVLSLRYVLVEHQLRVLLYIKLGNGNPDPLTAKRIGDEDYLVGLAKLAHRHSLIDDNLLSEIECFNEARAAAIHGLAQGRIDYNGIKEAVEQQHELEDRIQSQWLTLGPGKLSKWNEQTGEWEEIQSD